MNVTANKVLEHLILEARGEDVFRTVHPNEGWQQVFGGQLMAQSLAAARGSVPEDRPIVSFYTHFVARADVAEPIDYTVENVRDGRRVSVREVVAAQGQTTRVFSRVLFQAPETGLEFAQSMPDVPPPDACADLPAVIAAYRRVHPEHLPQDLSAPGEQAVDMRFVDVEGLLRASNEVVEQQVWIRFDADVGANHERHKQVLAYASDQSLAHIVAQPHGLGGLNPKLGFISLDHSVSFHRPFCADEWLLLARRCVSTSGGRAIVRGEIYDRNGTLVALVSQEAAVRFG